MLAESGLSVLTVYGNVCYFKVSELTNQITEKQLELDTAKSSIDKEKREQKKQQSEISSMKEMNKDIEK